MSDIASQVRIPELPDGYFIALLQLQPGARQAPADGNELLARVHKRSHFILRRVTRTYVARGFPSFRIDTQQGLEHAQAQIDACAAEFDRIRQAHTVSEQLVASRSYIPPAK